MTKDLIAKLIELLFKAARNIYQDVDAELLAGPPIPASPRRKGIEKCLLTGLYYTAVPCCFGLFTLFTALAIFTPDATRWAYFLMMWAPLIATRLFRFRAQRQRVELRELGATSR